VIKFTCPTCQQILSASDTAAGTAARCPKCGLDLVVPGEAPAPARYEAPPLEPDPPPTRAPSTRRAYEPADEPNVTARRRDDYEDYDDRPARRRYKDDYGERPRRRRDRYEDECPYCGSTAPPIRRSKMSQAGLITLIVMVLLCWPLFWIGLLMTESYTVCADCGRQI
jgi:DNA-directed RNA polymerase subunit RPC12/RpoP